MSFLTSLRPPTTTTSLPQLSSALLLSRPTTTPRRAAPALASFFSTTPPARVARMTIVGRLADSPELVPTSTGQDVIRYALGTHAGPRDNRTTSWWRVACFAQEGQPLRDLVMGLGKGSLVYVEGECSMNKFNDKEGKPTSALSIVQRNIEVMEKRNTEGEGAAEGEGARE